MNNVRLLDLDVYVSLDSEMMNTIKERTKERYASLKLLSHDIGITRQGLSFFLGGRATMTKNLRVISDKLGISEEEIQNHVSGVYSGPYKKFRYNLGFPIELNPMHIRLASHVAGDSSLEKHHCRWYQKSLLGGEFITDLIKQLSGRQIKAGTKCAYGIPILLLDVVCSALGLARRDLKSKDFVNKLIGLPREYGVQFLAAFIVDEGHIGQSYIKVVNTDYALLEEVRNLMISLGYSCSGIGISNNRVGKYITIRGSATKVNYTLYSIIIRADGFAKLKNDIDFSMKKYGKVAGLWHKQEVFESMFERLDMNYLRERRRTKNQIIPMLISEMHNGPIKTKEISYRLSIPNKRVYKILFRMEKRNIVRKVGPGVFALPNHENELS